MSVSVLTVDLSNILNRVHTRRHSTDRDTFVIAERRQEKCISLSLPYVTLTLLSLSRTASIARLRYTVEGLIINFTFTLYRVIHLSTVRLRAHIPVCVCMFVHPPSPISGGGRERDEKNVFSFKLIPFTVLTCTAPVRFVRPTVRVNSEVQCTHDTENVDQWTRREREQWIGWFQWWAFNLLLHYEIVSCMWERCFMWIIKKRELSPYNVIFDTNHNVYRKWIKWQ